MNTNTRIRSLYRAEVTIPPAVADEYEFTREYSDLLGSFQNLDGRQGQTTSDGVIIEWHESANLADAEAFASRWEARIAQWQNQLATRTEGSTPA